MSDTGRLGRFHTLADWGGVTHWQIGEVSDTGSVGGVRHRQVGEVSDSGSVEGVRHMQGGGCYRWCREVSELDTEEAGDRRKPMRCSTTYQTRQVIRQGLGGFRHIQCRKVLDMAEQRTRRFRRVKQRTRNTSGYDTGGVRTKQGSSDCTNNGIGTLMTDHRAHFLGSFLSSQCLGNS